MSLKSYKELIEDDSDMMEILDVCYERLSVYKILNQVNLENLEPGEERWIDSIKNKINDEGLKTFQNLLGSNKEAWAERNDNIGFWILFFKYLDNEYLREYFIKWESEWFHFVYLNSSPFEREAFFKAHKFKFVKVIPEENSILFDKIRQSGVTGTIYKAKWYEIPEPVAQRQVYLERGTAYFSEENLVYRVLRKFKAGMADYFNKMEEGRKKNAHLVDERIFDLMKNLPSSLFVTVDAHSLNLPDPIRLSEIDKIAKKNYPLCMRNMHELLRKNHHLKYHSKMQYGVFLYYLGLPYEDAMKFWKDEFTQKISAKEYKSKYEYLFKHQYGKVGRKQPYNLPTCKNILSNGPMYQQDHGCPFKEWPVDKVIQYLSPSYQEEEIIDIEDLLKDGKYQMACTKCLDPTTDIYKTKIIESPNEYVFNSIKEDRDNIWW